MQIKHVEQLTAGKTARKWYHLNLFPKFALLFFFIVAVPLSVIGLYVLNQNRGSIVKHTDQFIAVLNTSLERVMTIQRQETETALEGLSADFTVFGSDALQNLKTRLLKKNTQLYTERLEAVAAKASNAVELEFLMLNRELTTMTAKFVAQFLANAQNRLLTLTLMPEFAQFSVGDNQALRERFVTDATFADLRVFDLAGQPIAHLTNPNVGGVKDDGAFTLSAEDFAAVRAGTPIVVQANGADGAGWLQIARPIRQGAQIRGVISGQIPLPTLWTQLQDQLSQHTDRVYILDSQERRLYPATLPGPLPSPTQAYLTAVRALTKSDGVFQQDNLNGAFSTVAALDWKVIAPLSATAFQTQQMVLDLIVTEDIRRLEKELDDLIPQQTALITQEFTHKLAARKQDAWQATTTHFQRFNQELEDQITATVGNIAQRIHQKTLYSIMPLILGAGLAAILPAILLAGAIIKPIRGMTEVARQIAHGNVNQMVPEVHSHDEIHVLSQSFHETIEYLRHIAHGAQKISEGEFPNEITPVSAEDALGIAFQKMTHYLQDIATLAVKIAHGDLNHKVMPKSETDILGNAVYQMTQYLQQIAQIARRVAGGNLGEDGAMHAENDFLGNVLSEMILKLRHLVAKIRAGADQLVGLSMETHSRAQKEAESVGKISLSVEETSSAMNEIAATITEVNHRMAQLSSFVGESSSSIEELNSSIRQIATHGEQLATASDETSSSIQQIAASLQQIADTAQYSNKLSDSSRQDAIDGRDAVEKMIQSMSVIQQIVTITAEAIQLLNTRTESIKKILNVIKDISDQTSLLSINASIIAKKAGERGRGFNVIADKVRKLADQSTLSAKEIARIIRDVQKDSARAVEAVAMGDEKVQEGVRLAELAGKALDKIITGANESSGVIAKIAETTDEQTKISHYIMESMERVVEMVNQIKVATKEQEQSSTYIMQQSEDVLLLSQQVKQATSEQTQVVKHVSLTMDDIRRLIEMTSTRAQESIQAAATLSHHADALKNLVSQFTI